ncbi:MAG: hypothetical protein DWQ20_00545 [Actinobacteria bacterium]|nr:MAG: hypothetical protein DWQ20_00545 [Actinomycetota bacterium]
MHDFNPGIAQNGLFWTMEIPRGSLQVERGGRSARLQVADLPIPDTFFYSNNVSVSAQIDVDVTWTATADPVSRGNGTGGSEASFDRFSGSFSEAACVGSGGGAETGFSFRTGPLDADGFFAEFGHERNGVFLA